MRDLYDRSSRRLLCPPKLWLINDLLEDDIRRCKVYEDYCNLLNCPVLKVCPYLVSFKFRLRLFERITTSNRESIQGRNDGLSFRPGIHVHIMRGRVLEDGLIHLNKLGSNLRRRIIVQYVNSAGASETGLDVFILLIRVPQLAGYSKNSGQIFQISPLTRTGHCLRKLKTDASIPIQVPELRMEVTVSCFLNSWAEF
eukprot:scaffold1269_cov242-Chaetoceros_neogracile.AAC.1